MRASRVFPIYTATDLNKTLAWYKDVMGCQVGKIFEDEGVLVGAAVQFGDVGIWLSQDDFAKGADRAKGDGFRIILETMDDIDKLAESIRERGGELLMEPQDQPWGVRIFAVADPDGFKISISTPMFDVDETVN